MNINNFIENFANVFDETDISQFVASTEFKNLDEWNSLISLSVIAMVDEEYEVSLKGDDIRNAKTIEDLFKIVQNKK